MVALFLLSASIFLRRHKKQRILRDAIDMWLCMSVIITNMSVVIMSHLQRAAHTVQTKPTGVSQWRCESRTACHLTKALHCCKNAGQVTRPLPAFPESTNNPIITSNHVFEMSSRLFFDFCQCCWLASAWQRANGKLTVSPSTSILLAMDCCSSHPMQYESCAFRLLWLL